MLYAMTEGAFAFVCDQNSTAIAVATAAALSITTPAATTAICRRFCTSQLQFALSPATIANSSPIHSPAPAALARTTLAPTACLLRLPLFLLPLLWRGILP